MQQDFSFLSTKQRIDVGFSIIIVLHFSYWLMACIKLFSMLKYPDAINLTTTRNDLHGNLVK